MLRLSQLGIGHVERRGGAIGSPRHAGAFERHWAGVFHGVLATTLEAMSRSPPEVEGP